MVASFSFLSYLLPCMKISALALLLSPSSLHSSPAEPLRGFLLSVDVFSFFLLSPSPLPSLPFPCRAPDITLCLSRTCDDSLVHCRVSLSV